MFTILENYKTLMRMCMSAQMAGGPEMSFAELDGNQDTYFTKGDYEGLSTEAQMAAQRVVESAGFDINQIKDGSLALTEGHLQQFLKERGDTISGVKLNEATFAHTSPGTPETTTWHTSTEAIPTTYQAPTTADTVTANYGTINTTSSMSTLSTVTDASTLASLGDAWQEGLRVDNFQGKNYVVEGGAWKVDTGISGNIDVANKNNLKDYQGTPRPIEEWKAQPYPGQGNEVVGTTYRFKATVDGVTKTIYAVWMEVSKGCFALSEPLNTVYEQGDRMMKDCNYFVCDGAGCRAVPKQEITQTYVPPVTTTVPPARVIPTVPLDTTPPVYIPQTPVPTQPALEQPPVQKTVEPLERCLNYTDLLTKRFGHDFSFSDSSIYESMILNPYPTDLANKSKGYIEYRVKVGVPAGSKNGLGEIYNPTSVINSSQDFYEIPALLKLRNGVRNGGVTASTSDAGMGSGFSYLDLNGSGRFDGHEGLKLQADCGPFSVRTPDLNGVPVYESPDGTLTGVPQSIGNADSSAGEGIVSGNGGQGTITSGDSISESGFGGTVSPDNSKNY